MQKLAEKTWKEKLKEEILSEILNLTECHAYYVNRLCSKLWLVEEAPTLNGVHQMWEQLVEEEFGSIANELSSLTKNQRIVLQMVCKNSCVLEPTSDFFLEQVRLSPRSVALAMAALERTDHLEHISKGYRAIDPVTKYILSR